MRTSQAALALIAHPSRSESVRLLARWNERWQAYSMIGGHLEPREDLRDCCIRELVEETNLVPQIDFEIAAEALGPCCEFQGWSAAAEAPTFYRWSFFETVLQSADAVAKVSSDVQNRWLTIREIARNTTACGRPIADQWSMALRWLQNHGGFHPTRRTTAVDRFRSTNSRRRA